MDKGNTDKLGIVIELPEGSLALHEGQGESIDVADTYLFLASDLGDACRVLIFPWTRQPHSCDDDHGFGPLQYSERDVVVGQTEVKHTFQ